jgi:hypothetical protein
VPELPDGLAALVADLERLGFGVEREDWHPWPGGGDIELRRRLSLGVSRVRMMEDRGVWEVGVQVGRGWYAPFTALRALDGLPHEQRALSDVERRVATVELVQRFHRRPRAAKGHQASGEAALRGVHAVGAGQRRLSTALNRLPL